MKNILQLSKTMILIVILFTLPFCKKKSEDNCGGNSYGGVCTSDPTFKFWTKLPMYNTTIQVKDNSGSIIGTKQMSGYYNIPAGSAVQPDACTTQTIDAVFNLKRGKSFSYTATNGSNTWTGSISVDCSAPACNNVEVK